MAGGPKYRLDRAGLQEHLLNAPFMVEEMRRRAELGKEYAISVAPDAPPLGEGYIASFEVEAGTHGGIHHDRAHATLRNSDDAAVYVEFGTERTQAQHVLLSAMDVMGGWEA
jgi:hypothetical protein